MSYFSARIVAGFSGFVCTDVRHWSPAVPRDGVHFPERHEGHLQFATDQNGRHQSALLENKSFIWWFIFLSKKDAIARSSILLQYLREPSILRYSERLGFLHTMDKPIPFLLFAECTTKSCQ